MKACGDFGYGDFSRFEQGADGLNFFRRELWRAATGTAASAGCCEASHGSFPNQVALELGERGEDMEDEARLIRIAESA